jgi:hypothetical protein
LRKTFLFALAACTATTSLADTPRQKLILIPASGAPMSSASTRTDEKSDDSVVLNQGKHQLVEEFTANTLGKYELKLGSELELGVTDSATIGSDTWSLFMGIPTGHAKLLIFDNSAHKVAFGVKTVWLTLGNLSDIAPAKDYFRYLKAKIIRPSVAWTNSLSPRLKLHTFWAVRIGKVEAELSEKGERRFWQAKHPGGDYTTRTTDTPDDLGAPIETTSTSTSEPTIDPAPPPDESPVVKSKENQEQKAEKLSDISRRTLELQSLFGLSTDRFQITGEYIRTDGNKILFSTRIERMAMEKLKAISMTLTMAQQWINGSFQFRLGIGVQYLSLTGEDLDGEKVDEAGITPVPQVAFYWRF